MAIQRRSSSAMMTRIVTADFVRTGYALVPATLVTVVPMDTSATQHRMCLVVFAFQYLAVVILIFAMPPPILTARSLRPAEVYARKRSRSDADAPSKARRRCEETLRYFSSGCPPLGSGCGGVPGSSTCVPRWREVERPLDALGRNQNVLPARNPKAPVSRLLCLEQ